MYAEIGIENPCSVDSYRITDSPLSKESGDDEYEEEERGVLGDDDDNCICPTNPLDFPVEDDASALAMDAYGEESVG